MATREVVLVGLTTRPELNGLCGHVLRALAGGRLEVLVDGADISLSIKEENTAPAAGRAATVCSSTAGDRGGATSEARAAAGSCLATPCS